MEKQCARPSRNSQVPLQEFLQRQSLSPPVTPHVPGPAFFRFNLPVIFDLPRTRARGRIFARLLANTSRTPGRKLRRPFEEFAASAGLWPPRERQNNPNFSRRFESAAVSGMPSSRRTLPDIRFDKSSTDSAAVSFLLCEVFLGNFTGDTAAERRRLRDPDDQRFRLLPGTDAWRPVETGPRPSRLQEQRLLQRQTLYTEMLRLRRETTKQLVQEDLLVAFQSELLQGAGECH